MYQCVIPGKVETTHLPGVPLFALGLLLAGPGVEAVMVHGVPTPGVDTPQVCVTFPVVITLHCLAENNLVLISPFYL